MSVSFVSKVLQLILEFYIYLDTYILIQSDSDS